jgi:hypothetical protein
MGLYISYGDSVKRPGASPKPVENIIGPSVDLGEVPGLRMLRRVCVKSLEVSELRVLCPSGLSQ